MTMDRQRARDFYEEDEAPEKIKKAFDEGEPGTTAPPIRIHLAELMARHNVTNVALADAIGIRAKDLSRLKNSDVTFIRLTTLAAICRELQCQPGDLLTYDS
jgi:putative transcriptional regulator